MPGNADRARPGHHDDAARQHPGAGHPGPAQAAEPFRPGELLDETLAAALGPVDDRHRRRDRRDLQRRAARRPRARHRRALLADRRLLPLAAPWVRDLARGLQYQSRHGSPEPRTVSLLARLGGPGITAADATRLAETVDLAAVLTLGRVLEQVLGPGAAPGTRGRTRRPRRGWPG